LVQEEEKQFEDLAANVRQDWMDRQREIWEAAQMGAAQVYGATYAGLSGVQVMRRVDDGAKLWHALQDVLQETSDAERAAQNLMGG
jgi:hypothetical protein